MTDLSSVRRELRREQRSLRVHRFFRNRQAVLGACIVLLMLVVAVFAPLLAPADPLAQTVSNRFAKPGTAGYLLGADKLGRDLLSRIIYGARVSMTVGLSVGLSSMLIGMTVGLYACYYRVLDSILMRICDGLSAIPSTLLAIALMAVLGPSTFNVILALSIVYIPRMARISRSAALVVKEQTYIEALRSQGASATRIIWRHIAPNILSAVVVQASYNFANSIITEAALSFLGVGVPAPQPSWGNILSEGREVITKAWWMVVYPGLATAIAVMGTNIFGDGLRDILDPHTN
ncbi:MAG: ABC transporter permease [Oscillospiraceae bacterium]|nr:ABC transporter permease [Oscillospiraceae bacterium]